MYDKCALSFKPHPASPKERSFEDAHLSYILFLQKRCYLLLLYASFSPVVTSLVTSKLASANSIPGFDLE